ncbi:hypothetical protein F5X99DRAFT_406714 [Biscogniauxia marginata]|nr:hypothetical protein F5X99DRAFT_406714 [Biscogniauxia marginata]
MSNGNKLTSHSLYIDPIYEKYEEDQRNALVKWKAALEACLNDIHDVGGFGTAKHISSFVNPGLEVVGSLIPLPLIPRDAENIKRICRQAPFGKGDETVVDTSVRKTWELDRGQFRISNPAWDSFLFSVLAEVSQKLGVLFKRHKDSERAPGMIGTLVISLPSKHEGGEVHLSHGGKTLVCKTAQSSAFDLSALAWYSDVTHEVTELTAGYRLILTYNIILTTGNASSTSLFASQQNQLRTLLTEWRASEYDVEQQLYVLEHQYTPSSLSLRNLKGQDRAVCQALHRICSSNGFLLLFAKVTKSRYEEEYWDEGLRLSIDSILNCDGVEIASKLDIKMEDILGPDPFEGRDADSEDEEFTGNESMPATLRYHNTAAMIIPRRRLAEFFNRWDKDKNGDSAIKLMDIALRFPLNGSAQAAIARWAVTLRSDDLYRKAVRSCLLDSSLDELIIVIAHAIREAFAEDYSKLPDWNFWLSGLIANCHNLTQLSSALTQIEHLLGDSSIQGSLKEWRCTVLEKLLGSKRVLDKQDYDFIIGLLCARANDLDWISTRIIAKLADSGNRILISCILEYLLWDDRGKKLTNAEVIARSILQSSSPKLNLTTEDLANSYFPSHTREQMGEYCDEFVGLLSDFLKLKWNDEAKALLESSCSRIVSTLNRGPTSHKQLDRTGIKRFLLSLISVLQGYWVVPLPSTRSLFEALLRKYIIADIPQYPQRPSGWAHKPRGCTNNCYDCQIIDKFLRDDLVQETSFQMDDRERFHVKSLLPSEVFEIRIDSSTRPITLIVKKRGTEFQVDLNTYREQLQVVEGELKMFRHEYTKQLLGDDLYHELIMLESTPESEGAAKGGPEARKRKAEEPPELPNALKRPKQ